MNFGNPIKSKGWHTGPADCVHVIIVLSVVWLAAGCATVGDRGRGERAESGGATPSVAQPADAKAIEPTVVSYPDYRDPLIHMNRAIFAFNDVTLRYMLIPLSEAYTRVFPESVRNSVGNFFDNLKMPVNAVNHLLQVKPKLLGRDLLRFGINSTVGLLGLFDPAGKWWGLEKAGTGFEETLAQYKAGYGIYVVLPIIGPSDLRNGASIVADHFLDPVTYVYENPQRTAIQGFDQFQDDAPETQKYETLRLKSADPYIFFRNLYLQGKQRDADY